MGLAQLDSRDEWPDVLCLVWLGIGRETAGWLPQADAGLMGLVQAASLGDQQRGGIVAEKARR